MPATLKRSASMTLVDNKRRAVMDIMDVPVRRGMTDSFDKDLTLHENAKTLAKIDSPRTDGELTAFGKPSYTPSPRDEAADARFRTAPLPPASCVCAGGSKKVLADDVYNNHFRCGDCSGMLTKDEAADARFRTAPLPPASCVCAGGSKKVLADDVYGNHFRCGDCSGMLTGKLTALATA